MIERGWVKAGNFSRNPDKLSYAYLLTPTGIREKVRITRDFLRRKRNEFEALEEEIRRLADEVAAAEQAGTGLE